jgi:hypothetical protein
VALLAAGEAATFAAVRGLYRNASPIDVITIHTANGIIRISGIVVFDEGIAGLKIQADDTTELAEGVLEIALPSARRQASDVNDAISTITAAHL